MVTGDNDYAYIQVFINYLKQILGIIVGLFERLKGNGTTEDATDAAADGE